MSRSSASAHRGILFKNKNKSVQQPQEQQDEEEESCPIRIEMLAKEPVGGRFLRSSSSAVQGSSKKVKLWCDCGHYFYEECLSILRCPIDKCVVPMQEQSIIYLASPDDWDKHLRFVTTRSINQDPLLRWCPVARLSGAPKTVQEAQKYFCQ